MDPNKQLDIGAVLREWRGRGVTPLRGLPPSNTRSLTAARAGSGSASWPGPTILRFSCRPSSPSITTLDNSPATIESGRDVPYQTVEDNEVNIEWKKAVLSLEVLADDRFELRHFHPAVVLRLAQAGHKVDDGFGSYATAA